MADTDKQYITAVGFIQFDPQTRDANGKEVTHVVIKLPGGDQTQVRVTVWPEVQVGELKKGDFIAVDGVFTTNSYDATDGSKKTSNNISAFNIAVLGSAALRAEREVVNASSSQPASSSVPF